MRRTFVGPTREDLQDKDAEHLTSSRNLTPRGKREELSQMAQFSSQL